MTDATLQTAETTTDVAPQSSTTPGTSLLKNGGKLLGEVVFSPGTSLLLDGNIKSGFGHVISGMAARIIFGVPGMLLVAANSYSTSATGKSLLANITGKSK